MFNCSTNCLCPIRFATNGSTSLLNENFWLTELFEIILILWLNLLVPVFATLCCSSSAEYKNYKSNRSNT